MLHGFNHSCHFTNENEFARFLLKYPKYNMFCKMPIILRLAFPPPPLIMLLIEFYLIPISNSFTDKLATRRMELNLLGKLLGTPKVP